jgi:hypothetical protein
VVIRGRDGVDQVMTDSYDLGDHDELTTDPPRPPGTPDVDEIVGDPLPTGEQIEGVEPDDEDIADDTASVEPPD